MFHSPISSPMLNEFRIFLVKRVCEQLIRIISFFRFKECGDLRVSPFQLIGRVMQLIGQVKTAIQTYLQHSPAD